ncbi:MAG: glycosyltransferase family 25 protein [Devosia sp.]
MKTWYINLARRTDRRAFMDEQFSRLGLDAIRIEAVTPAELTDAQRAQILRMESGVRETGGYCVSLSHLAAMRAFLATGDDFALILEDDAVLSPSLPRFIAAFQAAAPHLDLLRIETSGRRIRLKSASPKIGGHSICRAYSWEAGRAGYIVSRSGAAEMLAAPEMLRKPHDESMFDPYEPLPRRLIVRQLDPALCIQEHVLNRAPAPRFASDLDKRIGEVPFAPLWLRLWRRTVLGFRRDIVIAAQKTWHQYGGGARKRRVQFKAD